jgi:uncharacterized YigZ family protein
MANFSYRTITGPAVGLYKEKGSRFLAFAYPVSDEKMIKEHVGHLQKKYFDARHHCFAWMLGADKKSFRAVDGGEPNHSAGEPILGQIRSRDLTDILILVVRYFGGVKLGVGGLAAAYKAAAADALDHAQIVENEVTAGIEITYGYEATAEVMRLVKAFGLTVQSQHFDAQGALTAQFKLRDKQSLSERMELLKGIGLNVDYNMINQ